MSAPEGAVRVRIEGGGQVATIHEETEDGRCRNIEPGIGWFIPATEGAVRARIENDRAAGLILMEWDGPVHSGWYDLIPARGRRGSECREGRVYWLDREGLHTHPPEER